MTDARLPGRWLTDPNLEALSDRLWRVHTGALMWSAEQGTDGRIPRRTLRLLHPDVATADDAIALVDAGMWERDGDDYLVSEWDRSQSLAADVDRVRERNRRNQQAHRDRQRQGNNVTADISDDVSADVSAESRRTGESEERTNRDRDASLVQSTFDQIWCLWPKQTSRKAAAEGFESAAQRHPGGLKGLTASIAQHADAYRMHEYPVRYVPTLASWLDGDRWDEALPAARGRGSAADHNAAVLGRYLRPAGNRE